MNLDRIGWCESTSPNITLSFFFFGNPLACVTVARRLLIWNRDLDWIIQLAFFHFYFHSYWNTFPVPFRAFFPFFSHCSHVYLSVFLSSALQNARSSCDEFKGSSISNEFFYFYATSTNLLVPLQIMYCAFASTSANCLNSAFHGIDVCLSFKQSENDIWVCVIFFTNAV